MERGLYDSREEEAELRKIMIRNCRKAVLLCNSTKLKNESFCRITGYEDISCMITDKALSDDWVDFLREQNITLKCS
jgi:DeoR/GlpR family transcriptional regulator of sugar metabolism